MLNSAPGFRTHPGHAIELKPAGTRIRVLFGGEVIADSTDAIILEETGYAPVHYIPLTDIQSRFLTPGSRHSRCPFKGEARYHGIAAGSHRVENAVWLYDDPYDEVLQIAGHAAFYEDKVTIETGN